MKNLVLITIITSSFLFGCVNPKVKYDKLPINKQSIAVNKILKAANAETDDRSVIIFTSWYEKDTIKIFSGDSIIYSKIVKTSPETGLGSIIPISNIDPVKIQILSPEFFEIKLKSTDFKKYKFVYIKRDSRKKNKFTLEYSNDIKKFY